jgi:hypothetical protein
VGEGEREFSLLQKQFLDISAYPPHGFRNEVATEGERAMGGDGSAFRKNRYYVAPATSQNRQPTHLIPKGVGE